MDYAYKVVSEVWVATERQADFAYFIEATLIRFLLPFVASIFWHGFLFFVQNPGL